MALLTVAQRTQVMNGLKRWWSDSRETTSFLDGDLYDPAGNNGAIADVDGWIDAREGNTAPDTIGYNGALSDPFKSNATADQKSDLFIFVAARRRSVDILKKLYGEVD